MIGAPARRLEPEWLDTNQPDPRDVRESLNDLIRINRYLGGFAIYRRAFRRLLRAVPRGTPLTVLDVGAGSAGVPRYLDALFQRWGYPARFIPLDVNRDHLMIGFGPAERKRFPPVVADAARLPFRDEAVDFVISSLFLHHIDEAVLPVVQEWVRVARRGVVINDLIRHRIPILFFRWFSPLLVRSPITRHDGIVSLYRAFTPGELRRQFARLSGVKTAWLYHWSFRMGILIERQRGAIGGS